MSAKSQFVRLAMSLAVLVTGAAPSFGDEPVESPSTGIRFRSVVRQYSPTTGLSTVLWINNFVTAEGITFEIEWFEPRWLIARYPTYPISQFVTANSGRVEFRNPAIRARPILKPTDAVFVGGLRRPPHSSAHVYDFTDLRYSIEECSQNLLVRRQGVLTTYGDDAVRSEQAANGLVMAEISGSGDAVATLRHKYQFFPNGDLRQMDTAVAEQHILYKLPKPRNVATLRKVDGREKAVLQTITEEAVPFPKGAREIRTEFLQAFDLTLPQSIHVVRKSDGALLHVAVLSGYDRADAASQCDDFLPESEYLRWGAFTAVTGFPQDGLSDADAEQADAFRETFQQRIRRTVSTSEALRLTHANAIILLQQRHTVAEFASLFERYFRLLAESEFPTQIHWSGFELLRWARFSKRTDLEEVICEKWKSALSETHLQDGPSVFREAERLTLACRADEEWAVCPLLTHLLSLKSTQAERASVLACLGAMLSRASGPVLGSPADSEAVKNELKEITSELSRGDQEEVFQLMRRLGYRAETR